MKRLMTMTLALALLSAAIPALADEAAAPSGYLGSFLRDFDDVSKKLDDLAGAVPADKFGYKPTPEVRSVSEVYIHVVLANYFLARFLGGEIPAGVSQDMEQTVTAKADVIKALKDSQDFVRATVAKLSAGSLDEEVDFFDGKHPRRDVLLVLSGHSHEHLGQSIAYARMAGVVPPWSRQQASE